MPDINDLATKLAYYQSGGDAPGNSSQDNFAKSFGMVKGVGDAYLETIQKVLANKKAQLDQQAVGKAFGIPTQQQAQGQQSTYIQPNIFPQPNSALESGEALPLGTQGPVQPQAQPGPAPVAPMVQNRQNFAAKTGLPETSIDTMPTYQAEKFIPELGKLNKSQDLLPVAALPTEAKARALAVGFTEDGMIDIKKFNAMKTLDPMAPAGVMTYQEGEKKGTVPGNTKLFQEPTLNLGERQDQFWQRQWTDLINKNDPTTTTSRGVLGIVGRANLQADRAIATLSKPIVTKQEAGNVMADIAGIYQGGAPTQFGMQEQGYHTLYGNLQSALQSITGNPQDVLPQDIKAQLMAVLTDMKQINSGIIGDRVNLLEKTQPNVIKHFPQEWQEFKGSLVKEPAATAPTPGVLGTMIKGGKQFQKKSDGLWYPVQ